MKLKLSVKSVFSLIFSLLIILSLCPALLSCGLQEYVPSDGYAEENAPAIPGFVTADTSGAAGDLPSSSNDNAIIVDEGGEYDDVDHVALYIVKYGTLPKNYISKKDAEALGWDGGSLDTVAKGKCIGGSYFGNYEGLLPRADGRKYYECDIDTIGKNSRGAKRIVYSNDGLVYYTDDHYETFTLLYGEE